MAKSFLVKWICLRTNPPEDNKKKLKRQKVQCMNGKTLKPKQKKVIKFDGKLIWQIYLFYVCFWLYKLLLFISHFFSFFLFLCYLIIHVSLSSCVLYNFTFNMCRTLSVLSDMRIPTVQIKFSSNLKVIMCRNGNNVRFITVL